MDFELPWRILAANREKTRIFLAVSNLNHYLLRIESLSLRVSNLFSIIELQVYFTLYTVAIKTYLDTLIKIRH